MAPEYELDELTDEWQSTLQTIDEHLFQVQQCAACEALASMQSDQAVQSTHARAITSARECYPC